MANEEEKGCSPHKDQQRGEEGKNDCIKRMAKKVRKGKGTIVVLLFFKVEKEENLVVSRRTKLGERNQLSEGGLEWRKVL